MNRWPRPGDLNAKADVDSGVYERHYQIKPGDVVLDLGAHVGFFSAGAAHRAKSVVAFEPWWDNFRRLFESNAVYPDGKVIPVYAAAYSSDGFSDLWVNPDNSGGNSLTHAASGSFSVEVQTVDIGPWLLRMGIWPNFIKIDTEGAEAHIILSLLRSNIKSPMAIECHSEPLFQRCEALLTANGMKFWHEGSPVSVCYAKPA